MGWLQPGLALALAAALVVLVVLRPGSGASGAGRISIGAVVVGAARSGIPGSSCITGDPASLAQAACEADLQPVAVLSETVGSQAADVAIASVEPAAVPSAERAVEPVTAPSADVTTAPSVEPAAGLTSAAAPPCRAAVLVHGGGYFMGDAGVLEASFAEPLRRRGYRVWNVDYPLLGDWPDLSSDPAHPWYPRPDVDSAPPELRLVHDRATAAVAPAVIEALASGCTVALLGVSAGGSIVADLAFRYPAVAVAVLVVGASLTPDRIGGAPLEIFYGGADDVVLPRATVDTCERWQATGSACEAHRFDGQGHDSPVPPAAALAYLLAAA